MSETNPHQEQNIEQELEDKTNPEGMVEKKSPQDMAADVPLGSITENDHETPEFTGEMKDERETNLEEKEVNLVQENLAGLQQQKESLHQEIKLLEENKAQLILENQQIQVNMGRMVEEGVKELERKKQALEIAIQKLERRQERIKEEMRTTFAGVSQDLAIRVQGFKDYLVGSLQDLAAAAEQLELPTTSFQTWEAPSPPEIESRDINPQFAERSFKEETQQIRNLLSQYRAKPDYYGSPWQLRRTFEPIHAERVSNWFFTQGGRGAIRSMGSRLQNILVASAIMSILYNLYGDRFRTLLLANTPERLGEWRRGLQDCLGISRSDFGPERGVVLFETPEALTQKADRIIEDKELPLVIIDQTEDLVSLSLLQFPLWLAFVPEASAQTSSYW